MAGRATIPTNNSALIAMIADEVQQKYTELHVGVESGSFRSYVENILECDE